MSEYTVGWISDSHLGYQQYGNKSRERDFFLGLKSALQVLVKEEKVDTLIHTGDLFHTAKLSSGTWEEFMQLHRWLKEEKIDCWTLEGNHDQTIASDQELTTLHPWIPFNRTVAGGFKLLSHFEVVTDSATQLTLCGAHTMPVEELRQKLKTCPKADLLLVHALVKEFVGFDLPGALSLEDFPTNKFQMICLGDVHIRKFINLPMIDDVEAGYPGSTELVSASEDEKKTAELLVFTRKTRKLESHHSVPFPTRPVFRRTVMSIDELGQVLAELAQWAPPGKVADKKIKTIGDPRYPLLFLQHAPEVPGVRETVMSVLDGSKWIIRLSLVGTTEEAALGSVVPATGTERLQIRKILPEVLSVDDPLFPLMDTLVDPSLEMETCTEILEDYTKKRLEVSEHA